MILLVGLGNPGEEYKRTRHNAGFFLLDCIAAEFGVKSYKDVSNYEYANFEVGKEEVHLVKPQTYMNLSGKAVCKAIDKISKGKEAFNTAQQLIVIHDDVDLEPGKIRVKEKGGDGGHNGLKSLIECLGTNEFIRLRVGVGRPPHPDFEVADYVLGRFGKEEAKLLVEDVAPRVVRFFREYFDKNLEYAKSRIALPI